MEQYNDWQTFNYLSKYGNPKPKVKHTYFVVKYGDRIITRPMYYSGCQLELKQFKMQGILYPDKTKFKIAGI